MKLSPLKHNFAYKIAALIMAFLLWFYVYQSQNPLTEQVFTVPLEPMNISEDLVLREQNTNIQLRVQGGKKEIENLAASDIRAYVELSSLDAGEHTLSVRADLPDGIQLVSVTPEEMTVNLDRIENKQIPVPFEISGDFESEGNILLDPVITPEEVIVYGASTYLDDIETAFVSVDLSTLTTSQTLNLPVQLRDAEGNILTRNVQIEPASVEVFLPVVSEQPDRVLPVSVSIIGSPAPGYQLSRVVVEPSTLRVFGSTQDLLNLNSLETVTIDITDFKASSVQQVDVVLPNGITVADSRTVNVVLEIEKIEHKTFSNLTLYQYNLEEGLAAETTDKTVSVTVMGPESFVADLTAADVIAYVDLAGMTEGVYSVPVEVSLPANISLVEVVPTDELVTITRQETVE